MNVAVQGPGDNIVDDMHAKAGAAVSPAGGEKRLEDPPGGFLVHAAAIVGIAQTEIFPLNRHLDNDQAVGDIFEPMVQRID